MEEERRVFYVGTTRAQHGVAVVFQSPPQTPFIKEFLCDPALRQKRTAALRSEAEESSRKVAQLSKVVAERDADFRLESQTKRPLLVMWKAAEEERRSQLNDAQFKGSMLQEELVAAAAARTWAWRILARLRLFRSEERRIRADVAVCEAECRALQKKAEELAYEQARAKAALDKRKERLAAAQASLREGDDKLDVVEMELKGRQLLGA